MASVKKLNGYDIKDETARNGLLGKQDIFQVDTLPTASADNLGQIYQYTGNTSPLVNGYFYQCQAQGTNPETYAFVNINVQPASEGGKTVDENGNLYLTDDHALDGDDQQYPLIYRTKSEDDSNVIKINAPVEIEENPEGGSRSLRVSGTLTAKDTKVHSLTIDGTVRSHGNIWMGRTSLKKTDVVYMNDSEFTQYVQIGQVDNAWQWEANGGTYYTANQYPEYEETIYADSALTEPTATVENYWTEQRTQEEWDSSKASIKEVKSIEFKEGDSYTGIKNVGSITGNEWNIKPNGAAELKKIKSTNDNWEIDGDGTFRGKKIDLESGNNNRMGSLEVNGAIKVHGESTVTGTSHIEGDMKLYLRNSGTGYARIYPEENETCTLGTPNHRFEKIYVKDLDVSGEGGIDVSHLDGVEEINENTLQFEKLSNAARGYYNEDGQYVGSTVTQYINSMDDLPFSIVSFTANNGNTYKFGATIDNITAWYDVNNTNNFVYTMIEDVAPNNTVYSDKKCTISLTSVASIQKEPDVNTINGNYAAASQGGGVSEIGVEGSDCQGITIDYPYYYGGDDVVYRYAYNGNGSYGSYAVYVAENSRASDWIGGYVRRYLWMTSNNRCPSVGDVIYCVNDDGGNPNNGNPIFNGVTVKSQVRQYVECIRGLTSYPNLDLVRIGNVGGQASSIYHGQYWDGSQLVDVYCWTDNAYNPRVGDTMYRATYNKGSNAATKYNDVIGTVTETFRPDNSVAVSANTGDANTIHNYAQKHFNYYQASLETVANNDSVARLEYGGFFNGSMDKQIVKIGLDSNSEGGVVDFANSTFASGQSAYVYDSMQFLSRFSLYPNATYFVITQNSMYPDNPFAITGTAYDSNNQFLFNNNTVLEPEGRYTLFGVQFTGVTSVDANTYVKIDIKRIGDTVQYTLDADAASPVYNNTTLIEKSNLTWAFYKGTEESPDGIHYLWRLAGGRSNPIFGNSDRYNNWINSKTSQSGGAVRNPQVGDILYMYANDVPWNVVRNGGNRPIVRKVTTTKLWTWDQGTGLNKCYTYGKTPDLSSYCWSEDVWGGLYGYVNSVSSVVPVSLDGIYYVSSTSQYLYYDGSEFKECFYREATDNVIYSDIKLNTFYYWRAEDGSYTFTEGKEHETVATKDDLPVPNDITISEVGFDNIFFVRCPQNDTAFAKAWWDFNAEEVLRYTDADIIANHVGDKVYTDASLMTEAGTITNISYTNEDVKVNGRTWTLDLSNTNCNEYFIWDDGEGSVLYSRMPNPEVGDLFYYDSEFETESGSVTEIVSGEPEAGTFYELETYDPQTSTGRYFWNGFDFVEAEKVYKSITLYGDNNDLGKARKPFKNVYAESVESPYGTITTKNGYVEVNGGKVTNVTEINYNGADYIYTTSDSVTLSTIDDGEYSDIKPVELTMNYCKWQSEDNSEVIYYTPNATVAANDTLYSDDACTISAGTIDSISTTSETVYTWTDSLTGNAVYSKIRQLLADDEIYDNQLCIRNVNPMYVTSSEHTNIYKESIIMNNDSITLVIRDSSGNVAGSCTLTAAKLNTLDSILS